MKAHPKSCSAARAWASHLRFHELASELGPRPRAALTLVRYPRGRGALESSVTRAGAASTRVVRYPRWRGVRAVVCSPRWRGVGVLAVGRAIVRSDAPLPWSLTLRKLPDRAHRAHGLLPSGRIGQHPRRRGSERLDARRHGGQGVEDPDEPHQFALRPMFRARDDPREIHFRQVRSEE